MSDLPLTEVLAVFGILAMFFIYYLQKRDAKDANKEQLKNERKRIAKMVDIDLKNIYEAQSFKKYYNAHKNDELTKKGEIKLKDIKLPGKLYNDKTLLYYSFSHEITKLDYSLSSEIIEFYNDLFKADRYWTFLVDTQFKSYDSYMDNSLLEGVIVDRYNDMKMLIKKFGDELPVLRTKLQEIYES